MEDQRGQRGSPTEDLNDQPLTPGQKLIAAIQSGNLEAAGHLLSQHRPDGGNHWISQNYLQTALLEACKAGQEFLIQQLFRAGAVVEMKRDINSTTALHTAAQLGFVDIADLLLRNHALVNALDSDLNTALILAVNPGGCTDMLNLLLSYHAKVYFQNSEGTTALMKAVEVMDVDAIRILMWAGSDLKQKNKKGQTARDSAVSLGISDVFHSFILIDETKVDPTLSNALTLAAVEGRTEIVRILLDCRHLHMECKLTARCEQAMEKAKSLALTKLIDTMCFEAKFNNYLDRKKLEIAQILIESGTQPPQRKRRWLASSLIDATRAGVYELVEIICRCKYVKLNFLQKDRTALMIAAERGHVDILKFLLSINAPVKRKTRFGDTALSLALRSSQMGSAQILIQNYKPAEKELRRVAVKVVERGKADALKFLASYCNLSAISQSLLKPAVLSGSTETVKCVIDTGADLNTLCNCGHAALVVALNSVKLLEAPRVIDMVTFLVENGASVNKGMSAESPLSKALYNKSCLQFLIEKGADVNEVVDLDGYTPLLASLCLRYIYNPHPEAVEILLDAGADPNKVNELGETALHLAAQEGNIGLVRQFLTAGADLEARQKNGFTPLFMAINRGHSDIIALLKRCGASLNAVDYQGNTALLRLVKYAIRPQEEVLRLLAYDKNYVNKQNKSGLTSLMIAARRSDFNTVRILLELGADPSIVDNSSDKPVTALSKCIVRETRSEAHNSTCMEMLIKYKGLATMPSHCNIALHQAIIFDHRQLVQLMVTHGMAPVCVDLTHTRSAFEMEMFGFEGSVRRNLTPLATALVGNRLVVARYLLENWFLTPLDLVGSPQLRILRQVLQKNARRERLTFLDQHARRDSLSFLDELLSQPMSLVKLSFVTVSALLGEVAGREERVRRTPLPPIIQDNLLFRYEMLPLELKGSN